MKKVVATMMLIASFGCILLNERNGAKNQMTILNDHLKRAFKMSILNSHLKNSPEDYSWGNPLQNVEMLRRLPMAKHEISEEIRQEIIAGAKKRMEKHAKTSGKSAFSRDSYDDALAKEYVYRFLEQCCFQSFDRDEMSIWNNKVKEKICSYPVNMKWELSGALLTIAQTSVGQELLLVFMTLYKKNPAIPKILFFMGDSGGAFGGQEFGGKLFYGVIIPEKGPLESVYNNANGSIDYLYSPRCAVVFHEMIHVLHKIEDSAMLVRRYVSLDVAASLFSYEDFYGNRSVRRREPGKPFIIGTGGFYVKKEYEDEKWKEIKTDFCGNNRLLLELKEEFTNDEEFYTIFGFFKDKDGQIKRDMLCESGFTSELFGYVRCGHWGPSNINSIYNFNVMVNYAIPGVYIDPTDDARECLALVDQEIEDEKAWTEARKSWM